MAIPGSIGKWTKYLLRYGGDFAAYLLTDMDFTHDEPDAAALEWRRLQSVWSRTTPTGTSEDKAICTFDLINITSGTVDTSWTTTDYTTAEGIFDTMFTTIKAYQSTTHTLTQYRWYRQRFAAIGGTNPFLDSGPPQRVTSKSLAGTGSDHLPYQVACAITEKTPFPRHWGRFYLPGVNGTLLTTNGRWLMVGGVNDILAAVDTAYEALSTAQLYPVVPVTQVNKAPARGLLGVTSLQVDDVPDVQRRRRPKQVLTRTLSTP